MRRPHGGSGGHPGPPLNHSLLLELPEHGVRQPSRVEGEVEGLVHVAAVTYPGDHETARDGLRVRTSWTIARGVCEQDCVLVERLAGRPPVWVLRPLGPVRLSQRRRYVRAPLLGTADLATAVGDDGTVPAPRDGTAPPPLVHGTLLDLGEGGAQILTPTTAGTTVVLEPGAEVVAVLQFAGHRVRLAASVVRSTPDIRGDQLVVVAFDAQGPAADTIRSEVLRSQVHSRSKESSW